MSDNNIIDLDALSSRDSATFDVKHPKTSAVIGHIEAAGPAHPNVIAFDDQTWKDDNAERIAYQRSVIDAVTAGEPLPNDPFSNPEPAKLRDRLARRMAVHVLGADFKIKADGKMVQFGPDTAYDVFKDPHNDWLFAPFREFVSKTGNFIGDSVTA